jgi:hypothetical protein
MSLSIINDDVAPILSTVADLAVRDFFLYNGGMLYQKVSSDKTFNQTNGVTNDVSEFGSDLVAKRDAVLHHSPAVA